MVFQTQVPISLVIRIQDLYISKYKYTTNTIILYAVLLQL
jgi:hypothetical protein